MSIDKLIQRLDAAAADGNVDVEDLDLVRSQAAEPALKLDVPLEVEVGWGANWGAAH